MDKTEKKLKTKTLTTFFYTAFVIYCVTVLIMKIINPSVIYSTSLPLFAAVYIVLPIVILLLPPILESAVKKDFGDCVKITMIISVVYAALAFSAEFGLKAYLSEFSSEKWVVNTGSRYLMLDDLQNDYELVGMSRDEAESLLGTGNQYGQYNGNPTVMYGVKKDILADTYFVLYYDENGIITDTSTIKSLESY